MRSILDTLIVILITVILAGFLLVGLTGCSEDDQLVSPAAALKVSSRTPDALMDNFVRFYGGRDLDGYAQLLHEDFIYTFDAATTRRLGPSFEFFTREDELITAAHMFCGRPVVNSRGQTVPAITGLDFLAWEQVGKWELTGEGHLQGRFDMVLQVTRDQDSDFIIRGLQVFTVALADISDEEGAVQPCYRIIAWQDLGGR